MLLKFIAKGAVALLILIILALIGLTIWGQATLGNFEPAPGAVRDSSANRVVMVFGATGSVGDGLLKAALLDPEVEEVHVVTRRMSPRIEAGQAAGHLQASRTVH